MQCTFPLVNSTIGMTISAAVALAPQGAMMLRGGLPGTYHGVGL